MNRRALLGLAAVAAAAPAKASETAGPVASYLRLQTLTASVGRPGGRRGVMTVEVGIDVPNAALRTRAEQSSPRLRAAYNTVVQRAAAALLPGFPPDIDRLTAALQAATDATLGRAGARILLGTVMVA